MDRKPDEPAEAGSVHQAEADKPERERRESEIGEIFDRHVDGVLRASEARFKREEATLHEKHDDGATQNPGKVDIVLEQFCILAQH